MEWSNLYLFRRNDRVRRIKPNTNIAVNHFQHRRWQIITLLEKFSGFWPYQSKLQQYPLQLFHSLIMLITALGATNKLPEYVGVDINATTECCLLTLIVFNFFAKLFFASVHQNTRRKAYERIAKHFETTSDPEAEVAVLYKGAEGGFKYRVYYMCILSCVYVVVIGVSFLQSLCGYLLDRREFRMQMPVPLDFGFDHSKYWYIIVFILIIWIYSASLLEFAYDLSYILQVRHVAALFKIVGMRLRKASDLADETENGTVSDEDAGASYSLISSAIDLHSECFDLVKLIEKSFSTCWSIILLLSTGSFGAGVHVVSVKIHDPIDTIRYLAIFMMIVLHFHVVFSQGQLIIDSANSVSDACCECKWYGLPKKSCKLLTIMMIRTSIPCQLTGAKLFPLSMESFGKMLKAGLSYYTVFRAKSR